MAGEIFISYSSKESSIAREIKKHLEDNGLSCWMAPESIIPGSNYTREIPRGIKESLIFLLLLSDYAQASIWVEKELERAISMHKIIIPFEIAPCEESDSYDFMLGNVQRWKAYEDFHYHLDRLDDYIKAILGVKEPAVVETIEAEEIVEVVETAEAEVAVEVVEVAEAEEVVKVVEPVEVEAPIEVEKPVEVEAVVETVANDTKNIPKSLSEVKVRPIYDYTTDIAPFIEAAQNGDAEAQCEIGYVYRQMKNGKKDLKLAFEWFMKAAEQGDARAQCNVGYCYEKGRGVNRDFVLAAQWYLKGAEQGDRNAQCNLGFLYEKGFGNTQSDKIAAQWYLKASEQGLGRAQCSLAILYEEGRGVKQDYSLAIEWYTKAIQDGHHRAAYHLGELYEKGLGVEPDFAEALRLYQIAAENDYPQANYKLGLIYYNGNDVSINRDLAIIYFSKAGAKGHAEAKKMLEGLGFR